MASISSSMKGRKKKPAWKHPMDDLVPPAEITTSKPFQYQKPEVSDYIARVIIGSEMDYDLAVTRLRPKLKGDEIIALATEIENNEYVKASLDRLFKSVGIDDDSRTQFVKQMWLWMYGANDQKSIAAARIFSRIFFGEQHGQEKVSELKMEGFKEGVQQLLGTAAPIEPKPEIIQTDAYILLEGKSA